MDKKRAIEESIAEYAKRLGEVNQGDEQSKRVKKRILQKLGKLKKDLAAAEGASTTAGESDRGIQATNEQAESANVSILSKEERKLKLRLLNKDLADFAQKKQLTMAKKRFEQAIRKGIKVDVHSFTNLINAYVRCSDLRGAEETILRMQESNIQPNLITYTTLLKGYSEMGDMKESSRIFFQSMNAERGPNVRSLNTFLRACVRTGMSKPALQSFYDFIQRNSGATSTTTSSSNTSGNSNNKPNAGGNKKQKLASGQSVSVDAVADTADTADYSCDASTYEYLIGLLCRSGNISAAEQVLVQFTTANTHTSSASATAAGGVSAIENTAIYISLATAEALRGDYAASRKWADLATDALKRTETATLKDSMLKRFQATDTTSNTVGGAAAVGGKRGSSSGGGGAEDDSRSVALFLKHRRTELEGLLESVQEYLGYAASRPSTAGGVIDALKATHSARAAYLECLSQVLHFGFDGQCDHDAHTLTGPAAAAAVVGDASTESEDAATQRESQLTHIAARLLIALRDKYGLDAFTMPPLDGALLAVSSDSAVGKVHKELKASLMLVKKNVAAKVIAAIDADSGCIDFPRLFTPVSAAVSTSSPSALNSAAAAAAAVDWHALPVKLEICSGDGEWVVAQAGADWTANATPGTGISSTRQPKALWVALELRCDRIQHTLAHYLLSRQPPCSTITSSSDSSSLANAAQCQKQEGTLHNLALLSGNAAKIIPDRIATGSIAEIFINHPQPPDRVTGGGDSNSNQSGGNGNHGKGKSAAKGSGGGEKNQGAHLLTQDFLAQLVRILKPGGAITIVTDNQSYGKSLAASIASLPVQSCRYSNASTASTSAVSGGEDAYRAVLVGGVDRYRLPADWDHSLDDSHAVLAMSADGAAAAFSGSSVSSSSVSGSGSSGVSSARTVDLWRGEAGPEVGHVTTASSYFDRMWDLGQKKRRWFIYVKKVVLTKQVC